MTGIGQVEFAERLGVANGSISKIENGRMLVPDDLIEQMASVLDCTPAFLVARERVGPTTRPWLRAYADASKKTVDQQTADCTTAIEVSEVLGLRRIPDSIPIFDGDLSDDDAIEQFALDVRAAAQLGDADVVGNSIRAAERLGCLVLPMRNELGKHLGLSVRANLVPVICVSLAATEHSETGVPGDRQRFTVAHELGHLGLHAGLGPPESAHDASRVEKQAHHFAGAFLGPGDALLQDLRGEGSRVTLRTLAILKERWGISIKALVMRFQGLGVIGSDQARSLYKQISARGWNKSEPIRVGGEEAIWLQRAIKHAAADSPDAMQFASKSSGIGLSYLQRWTRWSPPDDDGTESAQVLKLEQGSAKRRPRSDSDVGEAAVVRLATRRNPIGGAST
ncbi:MAG: XRE family transcriptional regulator [Actinomycetia bacterium]|nr:XRE family transcriptional regulator [Actinomycetes bacterium]